MEDFKKLNKMQCFREGGSVQKEVNFTKRDRKKVEPNDMSQDKKLVKKAFAQHDKAKHGGSEPTEIKLKKGGRAKKECGTVKKFKTGGKVENAYGAKKTDKDIKDIANTKRQKPALLCGGKSVKKMNDGGMTAPLPSTQQAAMQNALPGGQGMGSANDMERRRMMDRAKNAMKYLGPQQQNEFVKQGGMAPAPAAPYKKGGKVKKCAEGGSIDDDVRARAMKWLEAGSPEQPTGEEKPVPKKAAPVKLHQPDYSNEDMDRMGLNEGQTPVKKATLRSSMSARPSRSISKNSSRFNK